MKVFQIPVGPMQNFAYLVKEEESGEAIAVDSGWETEPIVRLAKEERIKVKYVCATHGHYDHVKTMGRLAAELGAVTVAFEGSKAEHQLGVRDGQTLRLGKEGVRAIATPGHTEDSVCYYDGGNLLTGDTLFIEAWGRTDLEGGSADRLFSSLHDVIMALPESTVIYPGHDYGTVPYRTLGEESRLNPALLARSAAEFGRLTQE